MNTVIRPASLLLLCLWLLFSAGCSIEPVEVSSPLQQCRQQLDQLQSTINDAGVSDSEYVPVKNFPTYRTNRFWSSFVNDTLNKDQNLEWRRQLHDMGMESLALEWRNLPPDTRQGMQWPYGDFTTFRQACSEVLFQDSLTRPITPEEVAVPDSYSEWQRVLGLYALTKHLATHSIHAYEKEMTALMSPDQPFLAEHGLYYVPQDASTPDAVSAPLQFPLPTTPLGIPKLTDEQLHILAHYHAPRLEIEQESDADKIGAAMWDHGQRAVATSTPMAYVYPSFMRSRQGVLLQLNYTFWFPARPASGTLDWYSGKLDGLVWRVTLDRNGQVLFYDSIHPCGCYHSIHLPQGSPLATNRQLVKTPLVFRTRFDNNTANPLLQIQAGTHYLLHVVNTEPAHLYAQPYFMQGYESLRSLPDGDGFRDWFDPDGLIHVSRRFERFFLWPLGVPSAGAMREQGHQAIAFVGKRHFDDAWLEDFLGEKH